MESQMTQKIEQFFTNARKKYVRINQTGFIMSQNFINMPICIIHDDILNLRDEKRHEFISINLNQVYKLEIRRNKLILFLDNDIELKIEMIDKIHL